MDNKGKMNWKTGTAEEFLDDCEECEGECKEFRTCKCGGDMCDKMIVEPLTQRAYFIKKCQDCGYCEVD